MKFEKVNFEQYAKDRVNHIDVNDEHAQIILPSRSTKFAAGYDFYAPFEITIPAYQSVIVPTGIKCQLDSDKVLMLYIRSSIGIKRGIILSNNTGVIDADYYNNKSNEGHILIALTNTKNEDQIIKKGERFAQGVILQYFTVEDEKESNDRTGGIGSTD